MSDNFEEIDPEEYFSMITIFPKKGIKVSAYLQDKEGNKILLKDLATKLRAYIDEHMTNEESTPVNSQLFPLINQMIPFVVPQAVGFGAAAFLLTARSSRYAISTFGLHVSLLMRYINQHNLKIITEEITISKDEIDLYLKNERLAEAKLMGAMSGEVVDDSKETIN